MNESDNDEREFSLAARRLLYRNDRNANRKMSSTPAGAVGRHVRTKVTMNLDGDLLQYFKDRAKSEGRSYQILINDALRSVMDGRNVSQVALEVREVLTRDPEFLETIRKTPPPSAKR